MGSLRFVLSILVIGSHFGGASQQSGTVAVSGFFVVSGYLMHLSFTNYRGNYRIFMLNRMLRIFPPFLTAALLTYVYFQLRKDVRFIIGDGIVYQPIDNLNLFDLELRNFPILIFPKGGLLPQSWSIFTELIFYILVPVLMWLLKNQLLTIAAIACSFLSFCVSFYTNSEYDYLRSPITALYLFLCGFAVRNISQHIKVKLYSTNYIVISALIIILGWSKSLEKFNPVLVSVVTSSIILYWLLGIEETRRSEGRVSLFLGKISYGMFLFQYLAVALLFGLQQFLVNKFGIDYFVGQPNETLRFYSLEIEKIHIACILACLFLGIVGYLLLERRIERIRDRIRKKYGVTDESR